MKFLLKQLISLILPVTVLIIIPGWIEPHLTVHHLAGLIFGLFLMIIGLSVMVWTISSFILIGKGTLAPWSPPEKLVIVGIYRYVRNPMIMGVLTVLSGESLVFSSRYIMNWTFLFFCINFFYFLVLEEPYLEHKFGEDYLDYKRNVRRWIPKIKPYRGKQK
jgi:protein-S-isoprenylcysteine O-methyltransferase Ste14